MGRLCDVYIGPSGFGHPLETPTVDLVLCCRHNWHTITTSVLVRSTQQPRRYLTPFELATAGHRTSSSPDSSSPTTAAAASYPDCTTQPRDTSRNAGEAACRSAVPSAWGRTAAPKCELLQHHKYCSLKLVSRGRTAPLGGPP